MINKNYVGLSVSVKYFDEADILTASQALDGVFDDNKPVKDTDWLE